MMTTEQIGVSYPLVVHLDAEELLAEKARAILTAGKAVIILTS